MSLSEMLFYRSLTLFSSLFFIATNSYANNGLIGWATCNTLGQNGTTGGGKGQIVRVSTKAALEQYANASGDYIILVEGSFSGTGMIEVSSNKTIVGAGQGATFDGFGINVNGKRNIILRNLTIKNANPDAIAMRNTHHVWIDHCDLSNSDDGLLDFTIGSDYLTVSWTLFHDHDKVTLANSGTQHFEDAGRNKVCYHHNWFKNTIQRNPRIGYGMGHVFNNYYSNISSYCVGYHTGASVLIENNYFYMSNSPLNQMYTGVSTAANYADAEERGNIFDSTSGNKKGTGKSFDPGQYYNYTFTLDAAADVPALVQSKAGNTYGLEFEYLPVPANGAIDVSNLNELWWSGIENVQSWEIYFGTNPDSLVKTSTTARSFRPEELQADTEYFWRVNAIKADTTIEGSLWRFRTAPAKASKPYPADGELHAKLRQASTEIATIPTVLSWIPAFEAASYKVYLDTTSAFSDSSYQASPTGTSIAPGQLKFGVRYFWRVDAVTNDSTLIEGEIWDFISDVHYSQEGITECEHMVLNGRAFKEEQSGVWFKASNNWVVGGEAGPGTMSSIWSGPDAICTVSVNYFDESDGNGWYGFYVNDVYIKGWYASTNNDKMVTQTMDNVRILKNNELRIAFYTNGGELSRTDMMNIQITQNLEEPQQLLPVSSSLYPPNQDMIMKVYSISGMLLNTLVVRSDANGRLSDQHLQELPLPSGLYLYTVQGENIPARGAQRFIKP
jgi:pectate lyase